MDVLLSEEVMKAAEAASNELLPEKSKVRYTKAFKDFETWKTKRNVNGVSSEIVLAYIYEMSRTKKPTTLWANYSMLKAMISLKYKVDIGSYGYVTKFLKSKSIGYKPVQARVFGESELKKFIFNAPDNEWLDVKVVCIFGICGATRGDELRKVTVDNIEKHGRLLLVKVMETKTNVVRSFTVSGEFLDFVERYSALRDPDTIDKSFFVNYRRGKCTKQVIGYKKFGKMPRRIAEYLHLPEPHRYTGHSFRRSSATILANRDGVTMETVKRHGSWKSSKVAEMYIEDSLSYKKRTGDMILSSITESTTGNSSTVLPNSFASQGYVEIVDNEIDDSVLVDVDMNDVTILPIASKSAVASQGYVELAAEEIHDSMLMDLEATATSPISVPSNTFAASQGYVELVDDGIDDSIFLDLKDGMPSPVLSSSFFASQGYVDLADDGIEDSVLAEVVDPSQGSVLVEQPLQGSLQMEQPAQGSLQVEQSVQGLLQMQQSLQSLQMQQSVQSSFQMQQPVQFPFLMPQPVQSPFQIQQPMHSPFQHQSVQDPNNSKAFSFQNCSVSFHFNQ